MCLLSLEFSAFSGGQYAAKLYSTRPSIKAPDSSFSKIDEKCQNQKIEMRQFG